jgi:tetratricopeptide (TPR) repeat protein
MTIDVSVDSENQQQLKKLLIAVKVNLKRTGILLAICDDINLRIRITEQYEAKLKEEGLNPQRVWIDTEDASLYHILSELEHNADLSVVTVLGANELRSIPLQGDKSEQDEFFFSLQWTRESLLEFSYPIILWLTDSIATRLAQQSPDFWSWRAGIFEFQSTDRSDEASYNLEDSNPIAEYQEIASKLEKQAPRSPLLISLYNKIGENYQNNGDLEQGLDYYRMAIELSEEHQDVQSKLLSLEKLRKIREIIDEKDIVNKPRSPHVIYESKLPVVESSGIWYRGMPSPFSSSLRFDKRFGRFSSYEHPTIYAVEDPYALFSEAFRPSTWTVVPEDDLKDLQMFEIEASIPLTFADFTGKGLRLIGEDLLSLYGKDYEKSRQLAQAIWSHPMNVHGIKYRSHFDPSRFCYAIFDRAARYLSEKNLGNLVDNHPQLLENILKEYHLERDSSVKVVSATPFPA